MQGNGRQAAAGKGREDHLGGAAAAADGGLQAAAVPMLPAMEVAEEPEKAPGGKSKDPNTYKVLSLVESSRFFSSANGCPIFHRVVLAVWCRGHTRENKNRLKQENMAGKAEKSSRAKRSIKNLEVLCIESLSPGAAWSCFRPWFGGPGGQSHC